MQNHKGFRRFICVTVLCALLMVSMGRATRVSAVGTTAAIAGTAFILTGAVYLSYIALTNGQVAMPLADDMHEWLGSIGRKVSQYPSGAEAYQDIYQGLLKDPIANVIDGVWTWTQDRIKSFVNDFSDTRINQDIVSYTQQLPLVPPALPYNYNLTLKLPSTIYWYGVNTIDQFIAQGWNIIDNNGLRFLYKYGDTGYIINTTLDGVYRNAYKPWASYGNYYFIQQYVNGSWVDVNLSSTTVGNSIATRGGQTGYLIPAFNGSYDLILSDYNSAYDLGSVWSYPALIDSPLYNYITGETTEVIPQESTEVVRTPQWLDPDNENRPIIPWVHIPDIPTGVPVPPNYTGPPQWGFPLAELLDLLEELAEGLMEIDAIARLINEFAGQHGDNYYLEYNDGDINYYTYYQPTIFDNDTEYVTYNIDVSEQQDIIPVDLNIISLYTHNNYLDEVKEAARSFGSAIGEYVAFWHNCDPVVTYTILGSFILILIGAFIGKWGHS